MCAIRLEIKSEDPQLDRDLLLVARRPSNKLGYPLSERYFLDLNSYGLEGDDRWTAEVVDTNAWYRKKVGPTRAISRFSNDPLDFHIGPQTRPAASVLIRYVPTERMNLD